MSIVVGTYRRYVERDMRGDKLRLVELIDRVAQSYETRGYTLTVRQMFYHLIEHHGLPVDSYGQVQGAINDGRMLGLISWTAIEDRGRNLMGQSTQLSPADAVRAARASYRRDLWADQPIRPEVWIEKQALEGVLERICSHLRVDFYATKGYNSQSEAWRAGRRFADRVRRGQRTVVIHLGDHDPSGLDMTRDNHERLSLFAGFPVPVERVALNRDQIDELGLPANPDNRPKAGDSRSAAYLREHGDQSWELDALDPARIEAIVERAVLKMRDPALWDAALAEEVQDLREMDEIVDRLGDEA